VTTDHRFVAHGLDVEVCSVSLLRRLDGLARGADRTHVTSYVTQHPDEFLVRSVPLTPPSADLRFTLDEPADADVLDAIVDQLGDCARDFRNVVGLLRARPHLAAINADVALKPLEAG
jgi:spore coat polysaccharide biosynthesis protein SpsF